MTKYMILIKHVNDRWKIRGDLDPLYDTLQQAKDVLDRMAVNDSVKYYIVEINL